MYLFVNICSLRNYSMIVLYVFANDWRYGEYIVNWIMKLSQRLCESAFSAWTIENREKGKKRVLSHEETFETSWRQHAVIYGYFAGGEYICPCVSFLESFFLGLPRALCTRSVALFWRLSRVCGELTVSIHSYPCDVLSNDFCKNLWSIFSSSYNSRSLISSARKNTN